MPKERGCWWDGGRREDDDHDAGERRAHIQNPLCAPLLKWILELVLFLENGHEEMSVR